jgi:hypothetical protein
MATDLWGLWTSVYSFDARYVPERLDIRPTRRKARGMKGEERPPKMAGGGNGDEGPVGSDLVEATSTGMVLLLSSRYPLLHAAAVKRSSLGVRLSVFYSVWESSRRKVAFSLFFGSNQGW